MVALPVVWWLNIGSVQDLSARYWALISRGDGYGYNREDAAFAVGLPRLSTPR